MAISAQEIDKKKVVLVDVMPTPNTTFARIIGKEESKGITPVTLDQAVDKSKFLMKFTGMVEMDYCWSPCDTV